MKCYIGIDPGKSGGIAVIFEGKVVYISTMPSLGDDLDITALYSLLRDLSISYTPTVILEDVHSIFGSSAGSNFTFGFVCGAIEATITCLGLKLIKVQPKKWQSVLWNTSDRCFKALKPGQKNASVDTKVTSLKCAKRLFPDQDFRKSERSKISHDGIIDATLIAEYGRIMNL